MIIKKVFGILYIVFAVWFAYIRQDVILGPPHLSFDYVSSFLIPIGLIALGIFRIKR
ncbi:MAG: hypothetical protein AAF519_00970 [Bacteroidota bacterium]